MERADGAGEATRLGYRQLKSAAEGAALGREITRRRRPATGSSETEILRALPS